MSITTPAWPLLTDYEPSPPLVLAAGANGGTALFVLAAAPAATSAALMDRLAATGAKGGARVLRAGASALEADFHLGIVRQLFELPLNGAPVREQHAWLRGPAALVPEILGLSSEVSAVASGHAASHSIYWLAANMSRRRPLLIVISDLQWADPASLSWLVHAARRMSSLSIAIVATVDDSELHDDAGLVSALLAELNRMPPPGLDMASPDELVAGWLAGPAGRGAPVTATPAPGPETGRHRPSPGYLALTPHEHRLVTMAINGLTNSEIARQFGVTRRTIEFHFTQIYRKLGIDRRAQLYGFVLAASSTGPAAP
jgi:DNA-binding CsgD family transcriptional regulator